MSTDLDLAFPCFFSIEATPAGRRHVGRVVIDPTITSDGATPAQATHRLLEAVRTAVRERDADIARRLVAIPADAEIVASTLTVPWRGRRIVAPVRSVRFEVGGQGFVCLPRLGATVTIPPGLPPDAREDAIQAAVDRWFRGRPERDEDEPTTAVEPWSDRRGDRVMWLETRVRVPWRGLEEDDVLSLLRALFGEEKLSGRAELLKVARRLDALYPDRLQFDRVPDPRVDALRRLVYEDAEPVPTVLVGPAGSGKTTLVHAAVRRQLDRCFAENPKGVHEQARLFHLDPNRVIAGQSRVGAWERRLVAILEHLVDPERKRPRDGLFVDQPLALARVGRSAGSTLTLTTVLRPWVERRRVPLILESTPEAWTRLEEMDRGFADLFQVVRVDAPRWEDAMAKVLANVEPIERSTGARFEAAALRRLAELERRFPAGRGLPGGMIDRLELLATRNANGPVGPAQVDATFENVTGLRPELFDPKRPLLDAPLRARVAERLIGQPDAVDALAEVVHVLRAGLARPGKPLAAWLLVGPTGVGKTEAAKVLAGLLFSDPERLVRLDMNEYVDAGAVSRLLGDGLGEGHLPARLRRHPVAVLLLDEIEKAHPAVADLLLQMLDEGRITDAAGRVLDLQRVVILLTSNVGAGEIARGAGFDRHRASVEAAFRSAVERAFRPELVNRLDRVLVFAPLDLPDIRRIARLQIARILGREGFLRRTVLMDVHPDALDRLAVAGFDPALGARALKRVLEAGLAGHVAGLLASVPLDRPLVLRVVPDAEGVRAEPRLLSFARPSGPLPEVEAPTEEALRALRDVLPPSPFRLVADATGSRVEGAEILRIRDQIDAALQAFEVEDPEIPVEDRHLARMSARARHFKNRHRARWRSDPIDWMGVVSFRSVREFLLDRADGSGGAIEVDMPRMPLLRLQVGASRDGRDAGCRLLFRGVVDDGAALWSAAQAYLSGLMGAIYEIGGGVSRWRRAERGWLPVDEADGPLPGAQLWQVDGAGLGRLLQAEAGVHLLYPTDAPPLGLEVHVAPPGAVEELPLSTPDTVVRLLVEGGEVEDLATGLSARALDWELASLLPTVWWARTASSGAAP